MSEGAPENDRNAFWLVLLIIVYFAIVQTIAHAWGVSIPML